MNVNDINRKTLISWMSRFNKYDESKNASSALQLIRVENDDPIIFPPPIAVKYLKQKTKNLLTYQDEEGLVSIKQLYFFLQKEALNTTTRT